MKGFGFIGLCLLSFFCFSNVHAGSVRLMNNTPYKLRAVIQGADGTFLGEVVINPEHASSWNDSYGQTGQSGHANMYEENATRSQTPYTILWYCMDGSSYAMCGIVATGAMVTARSCDGARMCKPNKKPQGAFPQHPEGEGQYLHPEEELPEQ